MNAGSIDRPSPFKFRGVTLIERQFCIYDATVGEDIVTLKGTLDRMGNIVWQASLGWGQLRSASEPEDALRLLEEESSQTGEDVLRAMKEKSDGEC